MVATLIIHDVGIVEVKYRTFGDLLRIVRRLSDAGYVTSRA
jgi:hypothetical protein